MSWSYFVNSISKLFAVTVPTGRIPSADDEDSLLILNETKSEDKSFIHLADNSITPIISVLLECVASSLIDLIDCGDE